LRPASLGDLELTSGECFVLQRVARNLPHHVVDKLLTELNKRCSSKKKEKEKYKDRSFATEETNKLLLPQETDKLLITAEEGEKEKLSLATDESDIV
jgi:hypothetical protein